MKVAAYVRVSTEEQKLHGLSIEAQIESLKAWATANGMSIVKFYNDAGFSARKPYNKRPAMVQLLEDIQNDKIDLVIFTKLDRWFRSLKDYFKVQEILDAKKVAWKSTQEDYETVTASGRFKVNIMLSVAENEADRTAERIRVVFDSKRERQEPLTGTCPKGYIHWEKKMVKDPETEQAVAAFFQRYMETGNIMQSRNYVNAEYGLDLSYQAARKMLKNTAYYGRYFGKDNMCPPYITKEKYDTIQNIGAHWTRKTIENRVYLFSGIVFCGECGRRMTGAANRNCTSLYYRCKRHSDGSGCPNFTTPGENKIENFLIDSIDAKVSEYKAVAAQKVNGNKNNHANEIKRVNSRMEKLQELFLNGLIDLDSYKKKKEEMEDAKAKLAVNVPKQADFSKIDDLLCTDWKEAYKEIGKEEKRTFWRILIKEIRIYKDHRIEYELNV